MFGWQLHQADSELRRDAFHGDVDRNLLLAKMEELGARMEVDLRKGARIQVSPNIARNFRGRLTLHAVYENSYAIRWDDDSDGNYRFCSQLRQS